MLSCYISCIISNLKPFDSHVSGFSAGSYTGIFVFRLLQFVLNSDSGILEAVVGGLAIAPSQIPSDCLGLHIIHVLEDKLCVWQPRDATKSELRRRRARLTLVAASDMTSARDCLGRSFHSYCSFVLHHGRLPPVNYYSVVPLQLVLAHVPVDSWVNNGSLVFMLLGWAMASGALPGGQFALPDRVRRGLRSGSSNAIETFETELTNLLRSTTSPGCSQQVRASVQEHDEEHHDAARDNVFVGFDCEGLISSLKSLLRDVQPENLSFLLDVALPWMSASPDTEVSDVDGTMVRPCSKQTVHGWFELISGRLGAKTAVFRLHIRDAKQSLWARWIDAEAGFFNGQILHGRFRVGRRDYDISGVVTQVARAKNWNDVPYKQGYAAVSALTLLMQLEPRHDVGAHASVLEEIVAQEYQYFSLTHYYKQNTRIVAEPRMKLLNLNDSLLRSVFGCALPQRPASDQAEHPKFAKAACMALSWFGAYRRISTEHCQAMSRVAFDELVGIQDLACGNSADPIIKAAWSPLEHLGKAFALKFWKFLLQPNSTLLLGLLCILSHWTLS